MQEKTIEIKTCRKCSERFEITDKDLEFYDKVSPIVGGKKYLIPAPTLCPECRLQARLLWRNERNLYKRKCDITGKQIISMYKPDTKYKVYNQEYWWGDKWDALDYGMDYNFEKSFFEQFGKLFEKVPKSSLMNFDVEECDYTNFQNDSKRCYLTFASGFMEDCMYTNWTYYGNNIVDSSFSSNDEFCYDIVDVYKSYNVFHSINCYDSNYLYYCQDCTGCSDCFGSIGLKNKKYYFQNKEYSKEKYKEKLNGFFSLNKKEKQEFLQKMYDNFKKYPRKNLEIINSQNCIGNYIKNSKNCVNCFDVDESEDCKYGINLLKAKDLYDGNNTGICELNYSIGGGGANNKVAFSILSAYSNNSYYIIDCVNCNDCFGCFGLRNKQYCILNKQYSKEEYEELVGKILSHMTSPSFFAKATKDTASEGVEQEWGEFFPASISPFGYNETVAQEFFPLSQKSAVKSGFNWSTYEALFPKVDKIIPANALSDNIKDIPDDILNRAIECEITKKPFKIIKQELEFYRKHNLPIPKKHPDRRHKERMEQRNPRKLFDRKCDKCGIDIKTAYSPERKEIIYCQNCYDKEVY